VSNGLLRYTGNPQTTLPVEKLFINTYSIWMRMNSFIEGGKRERKGEEKGRVREWEGNGLLGKSQQFSLHATT